MTERVGIVGMGLMGQAFIHNMRKSQFIVQGYDVDPKRMDDLKSEGGHPVDAPADAVEGPDVRLEMDPTSDGEALDTDEAGGTDGADDTSIVDADGETFGDTTSTDTGGESDIEGDASLPDADGDLDPDSSAYDAVAEPDIFDTFLEVLPQLRQIREFLGQDGRPESLPAAGS